MLRDHTSLTMCTQKMMLLNCCHFLGVRRPWRALASSREWAIPATITSLAGCNSHSSVHNQNLSIPPPCPDTLCNSSSQTSPPLPLLGCCLPTLSTRDTFSHCHPSPRAVLLFLLTAKQSCSQSGTSCQLFLPWISLIWQCVISVLSKKTWPGTRWGGTDRKHQGQMTKLGSKTTPLPYCTTSQLLICKTSVQIISFFCCSGIKRVG